MPDTPKFIETFHILTLQYFFLSDAKCYSDIQMPRPQWVMAEGWEKPDQTRQAIS